MRDDTPRLMAASAHASDDAAPVRPTGEPPRGVSATGDYEYDIDVVIWSTAAADVKARMSDDEIARAVHRATADALDQVKETVRGRLNGGWELLQAVALGANQLLVYRRRR
jgi:hypothetical protein